MKAWWQKWLSQIERRITDRRDSTSCLLLIEATMPILLLVFGLQCVAAASPSSRALYREAWMVPTLWVQGMLMLWLLFVARLAWVRRHEREPMPWLVQMTVIPGGLGVVLLGLAYGLKDSPMSMVLLTEFVFARSLLSLRQLKWVLGFGLLLILASEVASYNDWLAYAPLLVHPVYVGGDMDTWWMIWSRIIAMSSALPVSGMLFFLAATLHRHRSNLETLVRTDMLTGLANRREFMTRLEREAHRQARSGRPLSVVLFDVDHFKRVNDTWGHPAGDEVLARIGQLLRSHTREQVDTAARYGGEEFVLLLPETDLMGAQHVAEKISAKLRDQDFVVNGQVFKVTQSVGIAQVVEGDTGWALKVADRNLYQAKQAGRDRIVGTVAFAEGPAHA